MHIKDTNKNWSLAATTWYNMVQLLSEPGMTRDANGVKRLPMIRHAMVGQSPWREAAETQWITLDMEGWFCQPCSHGFHNRLALKNSGAETVPDTEHRSSKLPCKTGSLWLKGWFTVVSFSRTPSCGIWAWYQRDACLGSSRWTNRRKPALQRPETCEWRSATSALRHDKINKKLCRKESQLCCYPSYPFGHVIFLLATIQHIQSEPGGQGDTQWKTQMTQSKCSLD